MSDITMQKLSITADAAQRVVEAADAKAKEMGVPMVIAICDEAGVLRPTAINANQRGYVGADPAVEPVTIGNSVLYVQARGTVLREHWAGAHDDIKVGGPFTGGSGTGTVLSYDEATREAKVRYGA